MAARALDLGLLVRPPRRRRVRLFLHAPRRPRASRPGRTGASSGSGWPPLTTWSPGSASRWWWRPTRAGTRRAASIRWVRSSGGIHGSSRIPATGGTTWWCAPGPITGPATAAASSATPPRPTCAPGRPARPGVVAEGGTHYLVADNPLGPLCPGPGRLPARRPPRQLLRRPRPAPPGHQAAVRLAPRRRPGPLPRRAQRPIPLTVDQNGSLWLEDDPVPGRAGSSSRSQTARSRRSLSPPARSTASTSTASRVATTTSRRSGSAGPAPRPVPRIRRAAVPPRVAQLPVVGDVGGGHAGEREQEQRDQPGAVATDRAVNPGPRRAGRRPRRPPRRRTAPASAPGAAGSTGACRPARRPRSAARTRCPRRRPAGRGRRRAPPGRPAGEPARRHVRGHAEVDDGPDPVPPQRRPPGRSQRGRGVGADNSTPPGHPPAGGGQTTQVADVQTAVPVQVPR